MHTMFRRDVEPVKCPPRAPSCSATSRRVGLNRCGSPKSLSGLLHRITGNSSSTSRPALTWPAPRAPRRLQCQAWSEGGSKNYLVAEMNREHVTQRREQVQVLRVREVRQGDNRTVRRRPSPLTASCTGLSPQEGIQDLRLGEV